MLVALAQFRQGPRVEDRDRSLIGEQLHQLEIARAEGAVLQTIVDIEHAFHARFAALLRRMDRHAHDRAQAQVLDTRHAAEALVAARVDAEQRSRRLDHAPRDAHGQARRRDRDVLAVEAARHAHFHGRGFRTARVFCRRDLSQQQEAALAARKRHGAVHDRAQQFREVRLAHQIARDAGEHAQVLALAQTFAGQRFMADVAEHQVRRQNRHGVASARSLRPIEFDGQDRATHSDLTTRTDRRALDPHSVQSRSVRRAHVDDPRPAVLFLDATVVARDQRAVEPDIVLDGPPDGHDRAIDAQVASGAFLDYGDLHALVLVAAPRAASLWAIPHVAQD